MKFILFNDTDYLRTDMITNIQVGTCSVYVYTNDGKSYMYSGYSKEDAKAKAAEFVTRLNKMLDNH